MRKLELILISLLMAPVAFAELESETFIDCGNETRPRNIALLPCIKD